MAFQSKEFYFHDHTNKTKSDTPLFIPVYDLLLWGICGIGQSRSLGETVVWVQLLACLWGLESTKGKVYNIHLQCDMQYYQTH